MSGVNDFVLSARFGSRMQDRRLSRGEAADDLREQAASCRRLARKARTRKGADALSGAADQFDRDARSIDPTSEKR